MKLPLPLILAAGFLVYLPLPSGDAAEADDMVAIAVVSCSDTSVQERVKGRLTSNGIRCMLDGQPACEVLVNRTDVEKATQVLRRDHEKREYWIQFAGKRKFQTRIDFAKAMATVKPGMPADEVIAVLGEPDCREHYFRGMGKSDTKEIWRYGVDWPDILFFATLGQVYVGKDGKVRHVFGGNGTPPGAEVFDERELKRLLRWVNCSPSMTVGTDPGAIISVVNELHPLGKEKALSVISEYLRVSSPLHSVGRDGVFMVLRTLFDVPADPGHMPPLLLGKTCPPFPDNVLKTLPRFPMVVLDDVPLLLVEYYPPAEKPTTVEEDLEYFRKHCKLRDKPLSPSTNPLALLKKVEDLVRPMCSERDVKEIKINVCKKLSHLVYAVYDVGMPFDYKDDPVFHDSKWEKKVVDFGKLDVHWSSEKRDYVFADGKARFAQNKAYNAAVFSSPPVEVMRILSLRGAVVGAESCAGGVLKQWKIEKKDGVQAVAKWVERNLPLLGSLPHTPVRCEIPWFHMRGEDKTGGDVHFDITVKLDMSDYPAFVELLQVCERSGKRLDGPGAKE